MIRTIPDYPKAGIQFRDITTLLNDAQGFATAVDRLTDLAPDIIDCIAAIEARGFLFGGAMAPRLEAGLVPLRKKGKIIRQLKRRALIDAEIQREESSDD